jgi:hypothetical protein
MEQTLHFLSACGRTCPRTFRDRGRYEVAEKGPYLSSLADFTHCISEVWPVQDAVITVICAPDDGWSYHPKHVEQFTETE